MRLARLIRNSDPAVSVEQVDCGALKGCATSCSVHHCGEFPHLLDTLEVAARIENKLVNWDEVTFDTMDSCISHCVTLDPRPLITPHTRSRALRLGAADIHR